MRMGQMGQNLDPMYSHICITYIEVDNNSKSKDYIIYIYIHRYIDTYIHVFKNVMIRDSGDQHS